MASAHAKGISLFSRMLSTSVRFLCSNQTVRLSADQRKMEVLQLDSEDAVKRTYHGVWLRHNCRCPECYSSSTNMIRVPMSQVSQCKTLESVKIDGSDVFVRWVNSDHVGVYPLDWLENHHYSSEEKRGQTPDSQEPLVAESFPVSDFNEIISSDESTYKWLRDINYYGVSFIKGIDEPETALRKLAAKFPHSLHYFGEIYNVIHKEKIDDLGEGTGYLACHQDLLYYENPPGIEVFNCVRNDPCVEGGESILVDLYPIVQKLRRDHPEYFRILSSTPVTFQRKIIGHQEKFDLRSTRYHIQLNRFGELASINWNVVHSEPLCISEELVEGYYDALCTMNELIENSPNKLVHRLIPGECIVFNNRRMVHGRNSFIPNGGKRHFNGFYVHTDYIRSQFLVLGKKLGKREPSANVFMSSV